MKTKTRTITIDGIDIECRASAATYILYKNLFKEDLLVQLQRFTSAVGEGETVPEGSMQILLQAAYIMARQANPKIKEDFEEWVDQFSFLGAFEGLGEVSDLLLSDQASSEEAKKKDEQQSEK